MENNRRAFLTRLASETLYFLYEFEEAVIKSVPYQGYWVKFKGKEPFKAKRGSGVVAEGAQEQNIISEAEYNSY